MFGGANFPAPDKNLTPKYTKIFINNEFVDSVSGKTFDTINPATEKVTCSVSEGDAADIDNAVKAARKAFELGSPYRRMDASDRGRLLLKLADAVEKNAAELATLESMDNGQPFTIAYSIISNVAPKTLRYCAGAADKLTGETIPIEGDFFCYTRLEPVGVVGAIIPWNVPFLMAMNKVGAAIASGCTLVVKPSEDTPLSTLRLCALLVDCGVPPGVINVVPGYGRTAGNALSYHMDVDKITFTGSTAVGRMVLEASAKSNLKKCTLELGGKSPNIIFSDVDLDYAVEMAHNGVFFNSGQACIAGSRAFVHEDIYDKFVEKSVARAKARRLGDPLELTTESGPQVNKLQVGRVLELIESGKKEGAKLQCGGSAVNGKTGYFLEQTVFSDVTDDMRIAKEEIFGPVMQIMKFKTIEEVIPRANNTQYGLAAAVFTKDIDKAITIANSVQAGVVWVNCYFTMSPAAPFGGFKQSGIGREGSLQGLKEFCEIKTVIPRANNTQYGLAAAVFTKDIDKAITIANSVQAGVVWVNCYFSMSPAAPFGGFKQSGIGREGSLQGLKEFSEIKTVAVKIPQKNS